MVEPAVVLGATGDVLFFVGSVLFVVAAVPTGDWVLLSGGCMFVVGSSLYAMRTMSEVWPV